MIGQIRTRECFVETDQMSTETPFGREDQHAQTTLLQESGENELRIAQPPYQLVTTPLH